MKSKPDIKSATDKLLIRIKKILQSHAPGFSEYELLNELKKDELFCDLNGSSNLDMFKRHFLLMHCLYRLQDRVQIEEGADLSISPLKIILEASSPDTCPNRKNIIRDAQNPELKNYYLDWGNFENTQVGDVEKLLQNFWQDYAKHLNGDDALLVLGLDGRADQKLITSRYRELAALHHPDRGGDKEEFIKIRAAYEVLKPKN